MKKEVAPHSLKLWSHKFWCSNWRFEKTEATKNPTRQCVSEGNTTHNFHRSRVKPLLLVINGCQFISQCCSCDYGAIYCGSRTISHKKDLYLAEALNCDVFSVTITANILSTVSYAQDKQYKDTLPLSFDLISFVLETDYSSLFFPCSV
jgi:hypothetical protein